MKRLCWVIEPHYPTGKPRRLPASIGRVLRLNLLKQWYAPADEALEDALFDSQAIRTCAGIDSGRDDVPGATTILKFRQLLEADDLPRQIFAEVGELLSQRKLLIKEGTIVDATINSAPSSTKSASQKRTPEMPQSKKGNQGSFGMKARIGVDTQSGLVHTVNGTAANVADIIQTHQFLHGEEQEVSAHAGYQGVKKREAIVAGVRGVEWHILNQAWQSQIDGGGDEQGTDAEIEAGESPIPGDGGGFFPCPEKHLSPSKNAVSKAGEKKHPASQPLRPCQPLLGSAYAPQPRQSMNGRQIHAKLTVPAENPPSAGLQIAYFARKSPSSRQSFLKINHANHPAVPRSLYSSAPKIKYKCKLLLDHINSLLKNTL